MEIKASINNLRISPRKVRLIIDVVRGMETGRALDQLKFLQKEAAQPIAKLINSALANAEHNFDLDKNNFYIKTVSADGGKVLKRWMPKAHGRATPIRKRTSQVNLVLAEITESGKKGPKKQKLEAPVKLSDLAKGAKTKEDEGVKVKKEEKGKDDKSSFAKATDEKGKKIVDPRGEGRGKHAKIEGHSEKGFIGKMFRRKSG